MRYTPYGDKANQFRYKLIDNFCLFWLKYVEPNQKDHAFVTDHATSDIMRSWRGITFEETCWQHINWIKQALQIGGVKTSVSSWSVRGDDACEGCQIDLLLFRADNVVNLCEMKFAGQAYTIDKDEEAKLRHRIACLKETLSAKHTVHLTMITTYGVAQGKHSGIVQKEVVMDDLFE